MLDEEDDRLYKVLVNHEEQYSLWLTDLPVPKGWREVGKSGTRTECSEHHVTCGCTPRVCAWNGCVCGPTTPAVRSTGSTTRLMAASAEPG